MMDKNNPALGETHHGVFLEVLGMGVLLTGPSGIGKSELALGLINRGHRLIADDVVLFLEEAKDSVFGSCPPLLQDFLEVRGLGILNIRAMYGDMAIKEKKRLQLIINLVILSQQALEDLDRLHGIYDSETIQNTDIPRVTLPIASGRNMAVLVESAVRNQILIHNGYVASKEFAHRQQQLLNQDRAVPTDLRKE